MSRLVLSENKQLYAKDPLLYLKDPVQGFYSVEFTNHLKDCIMAVLFGVLENIPFEVSHILLGKLPNSLIKLNDSTTKIYVLYVFGTFCF